MQFKSTKPRESKPITQGKQSAAGTRPQAYVQVSNAEQRIIDADG
jgi:hypothetical protein